MSRSATATCNDDLRLPRVSPRPVPSSRCSINRLFSRKSQHDKRTATGKEPRLVNGRDSRKQRPSDGLISGEPATLTPNSEGRSERARGCTSGLANARPSWLRQGVRHFSCFRINLEKGKGRNEGHSIPPVPCLAGTTSVVPSDRVPHTKVDLRHLYDLNTNLNDMEGILTSRRHFQVTESTIVKDSHNYADESPTELQRGWHAPNSWAVRAAKGN